MLLFYQFLIIWDSGDEVNQFIIVDSPRFDQFLQKLICSPKNEQNSIEVLNMVLTISKIIIYLSGTKYKTIVTMKMTTNANHDKKGTLKLKTFLMLSSTWARNPRCFYRDVTNQK